MSKGHLTLLAIVKYLVWASLFIFGCAGSLLLRAGFSNCRELGLLSSSRAQASHCGGFSRCEAQAPGLQ